MTATTVITPHECLVLADWIEEHLTDEDLAQGLAHFVRHMGARGPIVLSTPERDLAEGCPSGLLSSALTAAGQVLRQPVVRSTARPAVWCEVERYSWLVCRGRRGWYECESWVPGVPRTWKWVREEVVGGPWREHWVAMSYLWFHDKYGRWPTR